MYKEDKDTWGGVTTTWHTCLLCKSILTVSKHGDKIIAEEWKEHK